MPSGGFGGRVLGGQRNRLPGPPPVGFCPGQQQLFSALVSAAMLENAGGVGSGEFFCIVSLCICLFVVVSCR